MNLTLIDQAPQLVAKGIAAGWITPPKPALSAAQIDYNRRMAKTRRQTEWRQRRIEAGKFE